MNRPSNGVRLDHLLRVAIWEAHGRQCAYSGEAIRFAELQIDHVIPKHLSSKPTELSGLLQQYGLAENFDLDGIENLLPTLGRANGQKGGSVGDLRTAHARALARTHATDVVRIRQRLLAQDAIAIAQAHLTLAWQSGQISAEQLHELFRRVRLEGANVEVLTPLAFADGIRVATASRQDIYDRQIERLFAPAWRAQRSDRCSVHGPNSSWTDVEQLRRFAAIAISLEET